MRGGSKKSKKSNKVERQLIDSAFGGLEFELNELDFGINLPRMEQDLKCDLCEHRPSFTNVQNLSRHVKSKHEGIRHNCDQCNYAATQVSSLKRHRLTKHSQINQEL